MVQKWNYQYSSSIRTQDNLVEDRKIITETKFLSFVGLAVIIVLGPQQPITHTYCNKFKCSIVCNLVTTFALGLSWLRDPAFIYSADTEHSTLSLIISPYQARLGASEQLILVSWQNLVAVMSIENWRVLYHTSVSGRERPDLVPSTRNTADSIIFCCCARHKV